MGFKNTEALCLNIELVKVVQHCLVLRVVVPVVGQAVGEPFPGVRASLHLLLRKVEHTVLKERIRGIQREDELYDKHRKIRSQKHMQNKKQKTLRPMQNKNRKHSQTLHRTLT